MNAGPSHLVQILPPIVASMARMADGWLEAKASLVIQNVILLVINVIGVWRWLPKAEKEAKR